MRDAKIPPVERHNRHRLAVDSRLEDELVGRIAQLRSPHEMRLDRFNHRQHRIDEYADLVRLEPGGQPVLGFVAALLAVFLAYVRVQGRVAGGGQDFRGPMAKPQRMALLTVACVLGAVEAYLWRSHYALRAALWLIAVGALLTCVTRTRALAQALNARAASGQ